jgi:HAD superfamily hydrolase (TIGR01509 family)
MHVLRVFLPIIDTILLDVDGTLVDSNDAHAAAWVAALTESGARASFPKVRGLQGMGADQLLPALDPRLSHLTEPGRTAARRQGEIFRERFLASVRPTDGARALLLALHAQGVRCVVATSASNAELEPLLRIADVGDLIDARATADDAAESKPAPDIMNAGLIAARARAINAVVLGDTRYDIQAAHAAGMPAIALRCGGAPEADLTESAATFDTPMDLARALETNSLRDIVAGTNAARKANA